MKTTLSLLLTFLTLNVFAQSKWQYGISFSPDYSYRKLSSISSSSFNDFTIESNNNREVYKPAFTTGLNLSYNVKRLSYSLGVLYSNKGYRTKKMDLTFGDFIDARKGFIDGSSGNTENGTYRIIYTLTSIDVPVSVKYTLGNKRLQYFVGAGIAANFFLQKKSTLKNLSTNSKSDSSTKYNKVNFSPQVSVGLSYKLSEKINLNLEPIYRYTLGSTSGSSNIKENLFSYGLNFSVYKTF